MQQQKTAIYPGDVIHKRYKVESVLGEGGYSTVYQVRDLQVEKKPGTVELFALKELRNQEKQDRQRLLFEGEVLKRLKHKALPHIYRIFQDDQWSQMFILLEYIKGPNLEILRKEQVKRRFSLTATLAMMEPIVDAVAYLHLQQPPVMHRDIKPANIIIPTNGEQAVLVDFGIAKEYDIDATTTAIRRLSPGYGAPEQYSGVGTDPRTDIYGLAATCYALLTGNIPMDAFQRMTTLVSKKVDPLVAVNVSVPAIPVAVARTISRAMAIEQATRFATVGEFWQELRLAANQPSAESLRSAQQRITETLPGKKNKRAIYSTVFALLIAFCLLVSLGFGVMVNSRSKPDAALHSAGIHSAKPAITKVASPTSSTLSRIAQTYTGTIYNIDKSMHTELSLLNIKQSNERINGSFVGLSQSGTFVGVLDSSRHIFFTVTDIDQHASLFFEGNVRLDGNLVGNYCNLDAAGQCTGGYGLWSVAPGLT